MSSLRKCLLALFVYAGALALPVLPSRALDLVRGGKPTATIVLPSFPLPVEAYAAEELRYHVKVATGTDLGIVSEDKPIPSGTRISPYHSNRGLRWSSRHSTRMKTTGC